MAKNNKNRRECPVDQIVAYLSRDHQTNTGSEAGTAVTL